MCPNCPRCPAGKFGASTGLKDDSECSPCRGGHFCLEGATPDLSGNCSAGMYCPGAAENSTHGFQCPRGYFCPEASAQPTACPPGTYGAAESLQAVDDCTPCDSGAYCGEGGLTNVSGPCAPGYFCNGSATHPYQFPAPAGTFTAAGAAGPTDCANGTFNSFMGQSECLECPDRYDCPDDGMEFPCLLYTSPSPRDRG